MRVARFLQFQIFGSPDHLQISEVIFLRVTQISALSGRQIPAIFSGLQISAMFYRVARSQIILSGRQISAHFVGSPDLRNFSGRQISATCFGSPDLSNALNPQPITRAPQLHSDEHDRRQPEFEPQCNKTSPVNPQPSTHNPQSALFKAQPSAFSSQPSTLDPRRSAFNPQPSTFNVEPSIPRSCVLRLGLCVHLMN